MLNYPVVVQFVSNATFVALILVLLMAKRIFMDQQSVNVPKSKSV